jgi:N-acetylated-alpha-linked acidic dipeptidase
MFRWVCVISSLLPYLGRSLTFISVLCSWDGEEYGLLGSTEWVEEYAPWLSKTAISYVNVDIAVSGPIPGADASPELHNIALEILSKVAYPRGSNTTLRNTWDSLYTDPESLGFGDLGSGSDYTAFLQYGIGAVSLSEIEIHYLRMHINFVKMDLGFYNGNTDPVYHYHSNYDSYHWMSTYGVFHHESIVTHNTR